MKDTKRENTRENIRHRIKSPATDLCTKVVNTCVEYKQELIELEAENLELKRKNKNLKAVNNNLKEQNDMLMGELMSVQDRLINVMNKFNPENICYNCDHFLDCTLVYQCSYCQKKVCECCIQTCSSEFCRIHICSSCFKTHEMCPQHYELPEEVREELMKIYTAANRYKYI